MAASSNHRPKVELHSAFVWTCDECGRDNFERAVHAPDAMAIEAICDQDGMQPYEAEAMLEENSMQGEWFMAPERVKCPHCGAAFETEEHGPEGEAHA